MKYFSVIIIVCAVLLSVTAKAEKHKMISSDDRELVHILNNMDIIAQLKDPPFLVRIIRIQEHGECDPLKHKCPEQSLFIAVSSFDEYPEQRLYVSGKAYAWEFNRWISLPRKDTPDDFVVFELTKKYLKKNAKRITWAEKTFKIYVNTSGAFMEENFAE